jgi:hypothetical protein
MGMDDRSALIAALSAAYEAEYRTSSSPDWAFQGIAPAIPYIGERFHMAPKKVLIYASAENLASDKGHREGLEKWTTQKQIERAYHGGLLPDGMPCVLIEPVNNGSLLMAVRHALHNHCPSLPFSQVSAKEFLEEVAVANPSKFAIAGDRNRDPAGKVKYWPPSKAYILADLALIKPGVIVIPRTILSRLQSRKVGLTEALRRYTILPNWQITARTVRNAGREIIAKYGTERERSPFLTWRLTRGAERWGMEDYLVWLDGVACKWVQNPS